MFDAINKLMDDWKNTHLSKGRKCFISDGIVDKDCYENSSSKICFFLKEAYSKESDEDWSLTEWLNNGAMTRMWGNVAEWTYGITNTTQTVIKPKPSLTKEEKSQIIRNISIVNVKKSNGFVQSNYEDLLKYANEDADFLRKELEILNPDIIVCGNNSSLLRVLFGATVHNDKVLDDGDIDIEFMRKNGYVIHENKIIIDFYHPANQYPSMMNYYSICAIYQQALKKRGN